MISEGPANNFAGPFYFNEIRFRTLNKDTS